MSILVNLNKSIGVNVILRFMISVLFIAIEYLEEYAYLSEVCKENW